MIVLLLVLVAVGFGLWAGYVGGRRALPSLRSEIQSGWFVLGFLFGPLGVIGAAIWPDHSHDEEGAGNGQV